VDEILEVECFGCKKPVLAQDAMPLVFEEQDGTMYNVVFHRPPATCAIDWSLAKLQTVAVKWAEILKNLQEAADDLRRNSSL